MSVAVLLVLGGVLTANLHGLVAKELYEKRSAQRAKSGPGPVPRDVPGQRSVQPHRQEHHCTSVGARACAFLCAADREDGVHSAASAGATAFGIAGTLCAYNGDVWKKLTFFPRGHRLRRCPVIRGEEHPIRLVFGWLVQSPDGVFGKDNRVISMGDWSARVNRSRVLFRYSPS